LIHQKIFIDLHHQSEGKFLKSFETKTFKNVRWKF